MKRLFFTFLSIVVTGAIVSIIVSYFRVKDLVYPHTFLLHFDVSSKTSTETLVQMTKAYETPFELIFQGRVYKHTYKDLGILLSEKVTLEQLFEPNHLPFPKNAVAYGQSLFTQRMILPTLVFTQDFYTFAGKPRDFSSKPDEYLVDNIRKTLAYVDNTDVNVIDADALQKQLLFSFGKSNVRIEPVLVRLKNEKNQQDAQKANKLIEQIFKNPIELVIQDAVGNLHQSFVTSSELKEVGDIQYKPNRGGLEFFSRKDSMKRIVDSKVKMFIGGDITVDTDSAVEQIQSVLTARFQGEPDKIVWLKTSTGPNSKGELAQRYIEVDISQQKLYFFDHGILFKTYNISSGLYYPTPRGHFTLMNKALDAYSDIYNVWMPFWMAFYYGPEVNAYFGIHELPYWYTGDGERKQRPREFLGSPHTGGCISLDIGSAQEVYELSYVGMDLYIYE